MRTRLRFGPDGQPSQVVAAREQIRAALPRTSFRWSRRQDQPTERFFLHVDDAPGAIAFTLWADTRYTALDDFERFLHTLESTLVDAAIDPAG